jgi:hypothetical protein
MVTVRPESSGGTRGEDTYCSRRAKQLPHGRRPEVPGGDEVVPIINELMPRYDFAVLPIEHPKQRWSM